MGSYLPGRHRVSRRRTYTVATISQVDLSGYVGRVSFFDPVQEAEMNARLGQLPRGGLTFSGFYAV